MRTIKIRSASENLSATVFECKNAKSVLIIASAMGVKQEFYEKFARFLVDNGITVITFDYIGIGKSLKKPIRELKNNTADWGKNDLESVIAYAIVNFPTSKKYLLGHSVGGQLIGLSRSSIKMDKIILVATQSGYWKFWKGFSKTKMWFNWHILFPLLTTTFGYLPAKRISGMEDLPKKVAQQWSGWGKKSEYLLSEIPIEQTVFDKIEAEITSFSIDDDLLAPRQAVDWMSKKYSNAPLKSIHLTPEDFNINRIGHFGIFKDKFKESLWPLLLKEMQ